MSSAAAMISRSAGGGATSGPALSLIGAPCDAGTDRRGACLGPDALRIAGLADRLRALGHTVRDRGNEIGPDTGHGDIRGGYRNLAAVVDWTRKIRDGVDAILADGECPVLLGGDHSVSIGSIMAVGRHCARTDTPLCVLWLDAHADFNTAATTPTGNLHGMPLAILCGNGPAELLDLAHAVPVLQPARVFQVGVRSIDTAERTAVLESGVVVHDMRRIDEVGMRAVMRQVLDEVGRIGGHLHVSFDLDFVDPSIAPGVGTPVAGGPVVREAQLCMEMIHDSGLPGSLDVVEVNTALDERNRTAGLAVDLIASLFGERILARVGEP